MFGLFGHAAYLFPALLVIFGIFWFKAEDGVTRAIKAVLSVMIVASFAAMIHIFMSGMDIENMDTNVAKRSESTRLN
ncbi:MAG: DNA translocase FtsK 4TM domain-containing protein, partial [Clostridia bacterium]|nr:DNA translocase FtsK 4TM domain-containing protein [Clostridia bacterium]